MRVLRRIEQGTNTDGRSGGMGGGTLPTPEYKPPAGWEPHVITSSSNGVQIEPLKAPDESSDDAAEEAALS